MKTGVIQTQINAVSEMLDNVGILSHRTYHPVYPQHPREYFRSMSYLDIWKSCIENDFYDIMLSDSSLIQINVVEKDSISYSYIESPYDAMSYRHFLHDLGLRDDGLNTMYEEYEDYLSTLPLKQSFTPIRYDYAPDSYREGGHPAAHIHIGHVNNVRIGMKSILSITAFVLFVIRQQYPKSWVKVFELEDCDTLIKHVRQELGIIDKKYWNTKDDWEMYLF